MAGEGGEGEGRIKTNPLCELVLVAMATIITLHLGEQEQGDRRGGGKEEGTEEGDEAGERTQLGENEKLCKSQELCRKMSRREKCDSSTPGGKLSSHSNKRRSQNTNSRK